MESSNNISRRDFVKGSLAVAGVAAVASAAPSALLAQEAHAAVSLADGTYQVCANVYVPAFNIPIGVNAYFTNPTDPNTSGGNKPDSPTTELNATLTVANGVYNLSVPLVNPCWMLLSATNREDVIKVGACETVQAIYTDKEGNPIQRISVLNVELLNTSGSYKFGSSREYAAYRNPPFLMSGLVPGYLNWTAHVTVDFDTAVLV